MLDNEILAVVDYVEDETFTTDNGTVKKYKVVTTMNGDQYKIGDKLSAKWPILIHGVPVKLTMDTFTKNGEEITYVKNIDKCIDLVQEKYEELCKPAPRNPKDLSIEKQTAVKCVCEMLAAGAEVPEDIQVATLDWLRNALK